MSPFGLLVILSSLANWAVAQKAPCVPVKKQLFENGKLVFELVNTYNKSGRLLQNAEQFSRNAVENYRTSKLFSYDARGNNVEVEEFRNGNFVRKTFRQFDNANKLLGEAVSREKNKTPFTTLVTNGNELIIFDGDGAGGRTVKTLDVSKNIVRETVFSDGGNIVLDIANKYNSTGKLTSTTRTTLPEKQVIETSFVYNTDGSATEETKKINGEPFERLLNAYDGKNLSKKTAFNRYGDKDYDLIYTYNPDGKVLTESYFYDEELITKKENLYDDNQNLIRQNIFERGKLVSFVRWEYTCL